jgi:Tol biopolymer transport system component
MALKSGTRLGPYEIVAKLGEGGMGEVYKATDTRLSRTVAIKVLPPHWAADAEMKQRFEHEAQTVASLNHPNICVLHDIGKGSVPADEAGLPPTDVDFLVMEFLDGETVAERIKRGPVSLDEALDIAIAVTDALDKAHRQGVVHRDLKPSNVMLTPSGPKLLDFGLAKTYLAAQDPAAQKEAGRSGLTMPGMLIGTLQYMAPEQLEGGEADARTDIFALGVLLHEMVTGKRVFEGKSRVLLMSAIATSEPPPLSDAEPDTPPALEHVVRTCLAKEPADRWQTARDLLAELQAIATGADAGFVAAAAGRRKRLLLPRLVAAAAVITGVFLAVPAYFHLRADQAPAELRFRVPIQLTTDASALNIIAVAAGAFFDFGTFSVSPDGHLSFAARSSTTDPWLLYVKPLGGIAARRLPGTEGASSSFWSPDGRWIAFVAEGMLKKVEATGGSPVDLCPVTDFRGGTWNADGTILFGSPTGLHKVPAEGGAPEALGTGDGSSSGEFWPHFLPDGQHFLYTAWADESARGIYAGSLGSSERTRVMAVESNGIYAAPRPGTAGYLLFFRDAAVYAQPFDPDTLALSGEPSRIADDVTGEPSFGRGYFSSSPDGTVAYFQNTGTGTLSGRFSEMAEWHLAWVSRSGAEQSAPGPPGVYRSVELGPDNERILVHKHEQEGGDIWVFEPTGAETRLTWDPSQHNASPVWSPDGKTMVFSSVRDGKVGLYRKPTDGSGVEELLHESDLPMAPMSWHGNHIVFSVQDPNTGTDLWVLSVEDNTATPFIATPYTETHAQISPDGKWIAYASDLVNRRREIHVKAFPSGAGQWQVSNNGGDWPRWRKDVKELLYHSLGPPGNENQVSVPVHNGPIYSVTVDGSGTAFVFSRPVGVLQLQVLNLPHSGGDYHTYAISPDAQQFLYYQFMVGGSTAQPAAFDGPDPPSGLMVVKNWAKND